MAGSLWNSFRDILSISELELDRQDITKAELVEELILKHGWGAIRDILIEILRDSNGSVESWILAAEVFWGAVLDGRELPANKVIALLYLRLPPDHESDESNLAWSIASRLKGVGYLSDYDPLDDPGVLEEINKIDPSRSRKK